MQRTFAAATHLKNEINGVWQGDDWMMCFLFVCCILVRTENGYEWVACKLQETAETISSMQRLLIEQQDVMRCHEETIQNLDTRCLSQKHQQLGKIMVRIDDLQRRPFFDLFQTVHFAFKAIAC